MTENTRGGPPPDHGSRDEGGRPPDGGLGAVPLLLSSPAAAFARLRARPQWWGLLALCAAAAGLAGWIALPQMLEEEARVMADVVERFDMPPDQAEKLLATVTDPEDVGASELFQRVGGAVLSTAVALFVGLVAFHWIARASGCEPMFRQSGAVFFLAAVASAAGALLKGVLIRVTGSIGVTLGPGALVPGLEPESAAAAFLDLLDVFSLVNLWLLATGVGVVFGAARGTAWVVAGAYWILKSIVVFVMVLFRVWLAGNL